MQYTSSDGFLLVHSSNAYADKHRVLVIRSIESIFSISKVNVLERETTAVVSFTWHAVYLYVFIESL